ncbi:thioredoxin [Martelella endophytica]|uniref:Thioredoxin n=1 Tax=Martelella endophytica TaxID=1486262 RepID=A0A0D5LY93_MAREN|nr:thioredoxin [Martelella endophytica]AJY48418.1 thioredoxin [Martelella endophytica]
MSGFDNPYGGSLGGQMNVSQGTNGATPPAGLIKDTTTADFARDVLEESKTVPVLVDFWAPWCGPCKQLGPIIEKVVTEAAGKVKLVKMNIDDHPSVAGQLGIQSIPAVIAFSGGQPVDGFMGAVPESKVREFIDKLSAASPSEKDRAAEIAAALEEAEGLLAGDQIQEAGQLFAAILQADPENAKALAGIGRTMVAAGQLERAREVLDQVPEEMREDDAIKALAARIAQIEEARKFGDPAALRQALDANPDDHEARMKLAKVLNAEGKREEAANELLTIMRKDREFDEDGARRQLLAFFEAWGPKDPATIAARRRLSTILFS